MFKRMKYMLWVVVLNIFVLTMGVVSAEEIKDMNVKVNNKLVVFNELKPYIENGKVLVPLRFISNELNADVDWDKQTKTAIIKYKDKLLELRVNNKIIKINGKEETINSTAILNNGSMFVPLRFVAETFGAVVDWIKGTRTAIIMTEYETTEEGRVIRTWNIPKNADEFEYILADIPNEMYEEERVSDVYDDMILPKDINKDEWMKQPENLKLWCNTVEQNIKLRTNVDWETINYDWAEELSKTYGDWDDIPQQCKEYVDWVKKNHIKITGEVKVEPSLVYMGHHGVWVRSYVKFIIQTFDTNEKVLFEEFYESNEIKKNIYYEGYTDFHLGTNNFGSKGEDLTILWNESLLLNKVLPLRKVGGIN